jgi:hypothetical protein
VAAIAPGKANRLFTMDGQNSCGLRIMPGVRAGAVLRTGGGFFNVRLSSKSCGRARSEKCMNRHRRCNVAPTKKPPEGGFNSILLIADQAAITAGFDFRR